LHRKSLSSILHGNVADFEAFGLNHRLAFPRKKLERLRAEPRGHVGLDVEYHANLLTVSQYNFDDPR